MSKKAILFGLVGILLASLVGGAFATPAQAAVYYPGLYCSPSVQSAASGQWVSFFAGYTNAPQMNGSLTWTAVGGYPQTGSGATFGTQFYTSSINEIRVVSVTDGYSTATCTVFVYGSPATPTPTPFLTLRCSPSSISVKSGREVTLRATGGNGSYSWSAPEGTPTYGSGSSFDTRFTNHFGYARSYFVTVTSNDWYYGTQAASCEVRVAAQAQAEPKFSLEHSVRNVTRGGNDNSSVTARNGDRLRFTTRIKVGDEYGEDVHIRNWLPQYLNYVYGSTTVDGVNYQDGVATGSRNDSLALGTLSPNTTYVVRFEATVSGAPSVTLTNSVNVQMRHAPVQNRTSTVSFVGSTTTPTPTVYVTPTVGTLAMTVSGRNITRGQTGEYATVNGRAGNTIEFVLRIRSGGHLNNVWVSDYLPAGLSYVRTSTVLNGYIVGDGITSTGLNIGSLVPGQEAVIRFSALVDAAFVPSSGQVSTTMTVQTRADGTSTTTGSMKVTFGLAPTAVFAGGIQTGPADSLLLALAIAALTTGLYGAYTRTGRFGRRMAVAEVARISGATPNFVR
jgi:uncharacterized repeat protein (TIGR01451 family)